MVECDLLVVFLSELMMDDEEFFVDDNLLPSSPSSDREVDDVEDFQSDSSSFRHFLPLSSNSKAELKIKKLFEILLEKIGIYSMKIEQFLQFYQRFNETINGFYYQPKELKCAVCIYTLLRIEQNYHSSSKLSEILQIQESLLFDLFKKHILPNLTDFELEKYVSEDSFDPMNFIFLASKHLFLSNSHQLSIETQNCLNCKQECDQLRQKLIYLSRKLCLFAKETFISTGRNPRVIAATIIRLILDLLNYPRSIFNLKILDIGESSVKNHMKELQERLFAANQLSSIHSKKFTKTDRKNHNKVLLDFIENFRSTENLTDLTFDLKIPPSRLKSDQIQSIQPSEQQHSVIFNQEKQIDQQLEDNEEISDEQIDSEIIKLSEESLKRHLIEFDQRSLSPKYPVKRRRRGQLSDAL